jgi:hypothetical protein
LLSYPSLISPITHQCQHIINTITITTSHTTYHSLVINQYSSSINYHQSFITHHCHHVTITMSPSLSPSPHQISVITHHLSITNIHSSSITYHQSLITVTTSASPYHRHSLCHYFTYQLSLITHQS